MVRTTVIIPTWNQCARLQRCLETLTEQTLRADQIVVVDNNSSDDTRAMIRSHFGSVDLVELPENQGTAGGTNAGLTAATGDYLAILNNDAYPRPTWLEALVRTLEEHREFDFATSLLLQAENRDRIDTAGQGFDPRLWSVMLGHDQLYGEDFAVVREVFCADHAAAIYRREVFDAVGELDESLFMYSDDVDLGFRARLLGYRCLYVPDAVVYHERGGTIGRGSPTQIRLIYRNALTVYLKNMPGPIIRRMWPETIRTWLGAIRHAPHRGAAMCGILQALWRMPATLAGRRRIQSEVNVDLNSLRALMVGVDRA